MYENKVDVCTKTKLMYAENENKVYWAEAVSCEVYLTCVSKLCEYIV